MIDYIHEDHGGRVLGVAWFGDRFATPIPGGKRQEELDLAKLTRAKAAELNAAEQLGEEPLRIALDSIKRPAAPPEPEPKA